MSGGCVILSHYKGAIAISLVGLALNTAGHPPRDFCTFTVPAVKGLIDFRQSNTTSQLRPISCCTGALAYCTKHSSLRGLRPLLAHMHLATIWAVWLDWHETCQQKGVIAAYNCMIQHQHGIETGVWCLADLSAHVSTTSPAIHNCAQPINRMYKITTPTGSCAN